MHREMWLILTLFLILGTPVCANEIVTGGSFCASLQRDFGDLPDIAIKNVGAPDDTETTDFKNKHDPAQVDKEVTFRYKDGHVKWYVVPRYNKSFLWNVSLTKSFWPKFYPELIGLTKSALIAKLGKPDEMELSKVVYYCDWENILTFSISDGNVTGATYFGDIE